MKVCAWRPIAHKSKRTEDHQFVFFLLQPIRFARCIKSSIFALFNSSVPKQIRFDYHPMNENCPKMGFETNHSEIKLQFSQAAHIISMALIVFHYLFEKSAFVSSWERTCEGRFRECDLFGNAGSILKY